MKKIISLLLVLVLVLTLFVGCNNSDKPADSKAPETKAPETKGPETTAATEIKEPTIEGSWRYTLDMHKMMSGASEGEEVSEEMKAYLDSFLKLYEGVNMIFVLDLKEDKSFTMGVDEQAYKETAEQFQQRAKDMAPELMKAMFGEETLNAMLAAEGKTLDEYSEEFAETMSISDEMDTSSVQGSYSFENGKLVLTPDDANEEPVTMNVELSLNELKVTAVEGSGEDAEQYKQMLPMVFTK